MYTRRERLGAEIESLPGTEPSHVTPPHPVPKDDSGILPPQHFFLDSK